MQVIDWQRVVDKYGQVVWRNSYSLLGNHSDAADCFSQTFISALEISQRRYIRNISALLARLATTCAIDLLRQRYRHAQGHEEAVDLVFVPSNTSGPTEQIQAQDLAGQLRKALGQLPPLEAEVFCLRHINNMSYRLIAAQLDIKTNTAGALSHRARVKLRNILEIGPDKNEGDARTEENKKTLTDSISALKSERVPAEPPAKDVDSVLDNLAQATGGEMKTVNKPITFFERIAATSPMVKAAAALIILATIITFALHTYQTKPPIVKETKESQRITEEIKDEKPQPSLEVELEKIERMFIARDIKGLLAMLNTGQFEAKVAAANYLAQIGDARVLAALDKLAHQYEGVNNPFASAIEKINKRLKPKPVKAAKKPPVSERITDTPAKKSEDEEKPKVREGFIQGWLVDVNDNPIVGEIQLGGLIVKTDDDGAFTIHEPTYTEFGSVFGRAFNKEKTLGTFFVWQKTNNVVDAEIIVKPLAKVAGFVTNRLNDPVGDFDLKLSVYVKDNLLYNESIGDEPWEIQMQSDGSFEVTVIPTDVNLAMTARIPGFKTVVKLDGLAAGKTLDLGQVVLEPLEGFTEDTTWDCIFKGLMLNEANEPIAGAKMTAIAGEERLEIQTDANGWFEWVSLPTDVEVKMTASAKGYGHNHFAFTCFEDVNERDVQIFPSAYDFFGKKAPGLFIRQWINVEPFTLEQLTGQVVLLSINDYLKRPDSITVLTQIYEKYSSEPFTVIAIHSSNPQATADDPRLKQLIEKNTIEFPFGLDSDAKVTENMLPPRDRPWDDNLIRVGRRGLQAGAMNSLYEVKYSYAYYLIDKNGILRAAPSEDSLEQWIELLLSE